MGTTSRVRSASRSRPPPPAYGIVLLLGAITAPFLLTLDGSVSSYSGRRSLSGDGLYDLGGSDYADEYSEEYSFFQRLEDVDPTVEERARTDDDPDRCARVFLYLPDPFAFHGHGSQINTYLMAVTTATYQDRAMLLLERPLRANSYEGGSQFGCPADAFRDDVAQTSLRGADLREGIREDFPLGFSRLVRQPAWLSRGCPVPCAGTRTYKDWLNLSNKVNDGEFAEVTCQNPDGSETNVVVSQGGKLRSHFRGHEAAMTRDHPSEKAERWALNLGATPREAKMFSNTKMPRRIWDFALGLMNRAGFLALQPWIARDVESFLKAADLPHDEEYSAVHVRRGDKLVEEARGEVMRYWRRQGYHDENNPPTDYIPFAHYLSQWDGPESCPRDEDGNLQTLEHNVYVATDDPLTVRREIAALPHHQGENTVLWNDCHRLTFYFNPTTDDAFHLNGQGESGFDASYQGGEDNCRKRYHRNIVSVADMMILSKARTFIGEYNSNWGRVIRTMRVRMDVPAVEDDADGEGGVAVGGSELVSSTKVLDTRIAFGQTVPRTPGK